MKTEEVFAAAMSLPESARILLATQLLDSVPACEDLLREDDPSFFDELDRRSSDLSGAVPYEELWKSIDASCKP